MGEMATTRIPCYRCGTCCIAPDISTLEKPVGVPCRHLTEEHLCGIYAERPAVCRNYRPDDICVALQSLPSEERVRYFLDVYDLTAEAPGYGPDSPRAS